MFLWAEGCAKLSECFLWEQVSRSFLSFTNRQKFPELATLAHAMLETHGFGFWDTKQITFPLAWTWSHHQCSEQCECNMPSGLCACTSELLGLEKEIHPEANIYGVNFPLSPSILWPLQAKLVGIALGTVAQNLYLTGRNSLNKVQYLNYVPLLH